MQAHLLHLLSLVACLLAIGQPATSSAADAPYPNRPIRLVVPFAVASDADQYARNLAASLPRHLANAGIEVLNHPGDNGRLASLEVRDAPADGYTLLVARASTHAILPALAPETTYRWNDFTVLAVLEIDPLICAVRKNSPFSEIRELLTAVRARPGVFKYAVVGDGNLLQLSVLYLLSLDGQKPASMQAVNFPSGVQATRAVAEGKVDLICNNATNMLSALRDNSVRGLFTTAPGRLAGFPDLPNARDVGLRDMGNLTNWTVLMAPRSLPPVIRRRWVQALQNVGRDQDWLAANAKLASLPVMRIEREAERFVQEQLQFYERLVGTMELRP